MIPTKIPSVIDVIWNQLRTPRYVITERSVLTLHHKSTAHTLGTVPVHQMVGGSQ